jgi:hypothetical protein
MSDSWERRNIAVTPGYNNPDFGTLTFTPTYDPGSDSLVVTASHPVFAAIASVGFQSTSNSGTIYTPLGVVIDSATQITIPNASSYDATPFDFTQLDFFNAGPTLIGTWNGVVSVTDMANPFVTSALSPSSGRIAIFGQGFLFSLNGPVDRIDIDFFDLSIDTFYDPSGPNAGLNPPGTTILPINDTGIDITYAPMSGKVAANVTISDVDSDYSLTFTVGPLPIL